MTQPRLDPNGIPDLVRRLSSDSKRLVADELRLAKLEATEKVERAGVGVMWTAIAFGAGVVALVALTLLLVTLIGRLVAGHMWVGALVTGVVELAVAVWLVRRGIGAFGKPSYSLEETRESLSETASVLKAVR